MMRFSAWTSWVVLVAGSLSTLSCVTTPPGFTAMQLRQMQTRTYEVPFDHVFYAAKTVLQDNSFLITDLKTDESQANEPDQSSDQGFVLAKKLVTLADPSKRRFDRTPSCSSLRSMDTNNRLKDMFRKIKGKRRKHAKEAEKTPERAQLVKKCAHEKRFPKPIPEYDVLRTDTLNANFEKNGNATGIRLLLSRKIMTNKARERGYTIERLKPYQQLLNQITVEIERRKIKSAHSEGFGAGA